LSRKQKNRSLVITLVSTTVIVPFILFSVSLRPWSGSTKLQLLMHEITHPIEFLWKKSVNVAADVWHQYFANVGAVRDNVKLRADLDVLKSKLLNYEEKEQEIARLRKLLGFAESVQRELVAAEVMGPPQSQGFLSIRIARGELEGVQPGMPVITPDGIAGRVLRTGMTYADVQLLTDPNFNLDVILQRTRVRGVVQGIGGGRCLLRLSRNTDIKIGDTLVTSGIVGGVTKGLPVGRVMRISYESDNITQKITIEPWVDYRTLEEVVVLKQVDATLQKISETAGSEWLKDSLEGLSGG
jgi:rod shape-determining protein MreC